MTPTTTAPALDLAADPEFRAGLETILDRHYDEMFPKCATCGDNKFIVRGGPGDQLYREPCPDCDKSRPVVPHSDGPRLVFADWLEERGESWAEFIRVQCEIPGYIAANHPGIMSCEGKGPPRLAGSNKRCKCRSCYLRRTERALLARHGDRWARMLLGGVFPYGVGVTATEARLWQGQQSQTVVASWEWAGGFPSRFTVPRLADFIGEVCATCDGSGGTSLLGNEGEACYNCHGTGRVGGIGRALVAAVPVANVRVGDREPLRNSFSEQSEDWFWAKDVTGARNSISADVWDLIQASQGESEIFKGFPTEAAAHAALTRAVIDLCRRG